MRPCSGMHMDPALSPNYRRYALTLLLAVNLLNYIDRQVLYAVFPLIKADLRLSDTALGFLGSSFMLCYMLSAPLLGWLGDRLSRVRLAAAGLLVWSLATSLAGFANGYRALLAARTCVGIGEASFGTVSPGLVADYFPRERRGRVLAWFYLAIPVGSALGYLCGGIIGARFGWHAAFPHGRPARSHHCPPLKFPSGTGAWRRGNAGHPARGDGIRCPLH